MEEDEDDCREGCMLFLEDALQEIKELDEAEFANSWRGRSGRYKYKWENPVGIRIEEFLNGR